MIHTVISIGFIAVIIFIACGLMLLATLMIANAMAARQEKEEQGLPAQYFDDANYKRGA